MAELARYREVLGYDLERLELKELKKCFKKKSLAMLPEKHPTVANAHSRFEEVNHSFVEVILKVERRSWFSFLGISLEITGLVSS